eukprot:m.193533 g.193533  ORF g.193533 m.193533 type:complete len:83 (+) comp15442_c0_seq2:4150-4398(+)
MCRGMQILSESGANASQGLEESAYTYSSPLYSSERLDGGTMLTHSMPGSLSPLDQPSRVAGESDIDPGTMYIEVREASEPIY